MTRRRRMGMLFAAATAGTAIAVLSGRILETARRVRDTAGGPAEPGGRLISSARGYDAWSAAFLGPLFRRVAREIAAASNAGDAILEVGCGPGHLAIRLAREHGLRVSAVDLDPAMVARATGNAERGFAHDDPSSPSFAQADVASLPFAEGSFDLVVSTFSMHHWSDPAAGLTELYRVLRPGGRALIWDLVAPIRRLESRTEPAAAVAARSPFETAVVVPWRWPWRLVLVERIELTKPEPDGGGWPDRRGQREDRARPDDGGRQHA